MYVLPVALIMVLANVAQQDDTMQQPAPPPAAQPQARPLPVKPPPPPEDVEPPHPFPPALPPGQRSTYGFDDYLDWGSDLQGDPMPNPQQYETHHD